MFIGRVGGVFQKLERTKNEQSLTGGGQKSRVPKMGVCSSFYDIDPPKSFRNRRIAGKQAGISVPIFFSSLLLLYLYFFFFWNLEQTAVVCGFAQERTLEPLEQTAVVFDFPVFLWYSGAHFYKGVFHGHKTVY